MMKKSVVERIEELQRDFERIHELLGVSPAEYKDELRKSKSEFLEIVKTGRYTLASLKLLRWLGFSDEEIDFEKVVKGIAIIYSVVTAINVAEKFSNMNSYPMNSA